MPASLLPALALWLGIQLLALTLAAARIPLSANAPALPERLAPDLMLIAQFSAAAMLFPLLFHSRKSAALIVLTAWPMLQLAGFLAATPSGRLLLAAGFTTAWLLALALLAHLLQSQRTRLLAAALITALTLGGPLLWYIRAEFVRHGSAINWHSDALLGPLMGALAQLHAPAPGLLPWLFLAALLIITATWALVRRHLPRPAATP